VVRAPNIGSGSLNTGQVPRNGRDNWMVDG